MIYHFFEISLKPLGRPNLTYKKRILQAIPKTKVMVENDRKWQIPPESEYPASTAFPPKWSLKKCFAIIHTNFTQSISTVPIWLFLLHDTFRFVGSYRILVYLFTGNPSFLQESQESKLPKITHAYCTTS